MVKNLSCVSYGSLKRFPHTFTPRNRSKKQVQETGPRNGSQKQIPETGPRNGSQIQVPETGSKNKFQKWSPTCFKHGPSFYRMQGYTQG